MQRQAIRQIELVATAMTKSHVAGHIGNVIDLNRCTIGEAAFTNCCEQELDIQGVLDLPNFLTPRVIAKVVSEGVQH